MHQMMSPPRSAAQQVCTRRLDEWNGLVETAFENLYVDAPAGPFEARFELRRRGDLDIVHVATSAAVVSRGRMPSRHGAGPRYFKLGVQDVGASFNAFGPQDALLQPGDLLMFDTARPYTIRYEQPASMLLVRLSEETMAERFRAPETFVGRRIAAGGPGGSLLAGYVRNLWNGPADRFEPSGPSAVETLLDLLDQVDRSTAERGRGVSELPGRIRRFVDENLCDPDLSVNGIARDLGITPRYVQMVFAGAATTPLAYIRGRRLELAAQALRSAARPVSITELSFSLGFNDLSHFSRAFRSHFGVSPREYRARLR